MKYQILSLPGAVLFGCISALVSIPANAGSVTLVNLIEFMYVNKQLNQEQYETLKKGIRADKEQVEAMKIVKEEPKEY